MKFTQDYIDRYKKGEGGGTKQTGTYNPDVYQEATQQNVDGAQQSKDSNGPQNFLDFYKKQIGSQTGGLEMAPARDPQWGSRIGADPSMGFTADFRDSDGDGVDDRNQKGPGQPKMKTGAEFGQVNNKAKKGDGDSGDNGNTADPENGQNTGDQGEGDKGEGDKGEGDKGEGDKGEGDKGEGNDGNNNSPGRGTGYINFKGIMDGIYGYEPNQDDDVGRAMKNAFGYDMMGKFFDSYLSRGMGQYQAGLSKDMMNHAFSLEQMGLSNSRKEEFGYGMRAMDKQYELQNLFANQEHSRALGSLAATGEQERKSVSNRQNELRKGMVVKGEQDRLLEAARGDQTRKNYAAEGYQNRLGRMVDGNETRKTWETRGKQDRMLEATRGDQTRQTERVKGQEERLNIGKRGSEERKSADFNDQLLARKTSRERSRASAAARAF